MDGGAALSVTVAAWGRLNRQALVNCSIVHSRDDRREVCASERVRYAGVYVCGTRERECPPCGREDRYVYRALMPRVSISYRLH